MKKIFATLLALCLLNTASFSDVKLGIILGFTGPIESLTPDMAAGAVLAIYEVNKAVNFSMGKVSGVRADSTCIDSSAATAAFQTIYPYKSKQENRNENKLNHNQEKPLLLGTCHAFNTNSEVVKRLWPKWYEN